ncbi:MAG TPA: DNA-processing protein DprA [Clostridia bacterium]|nr:DNA-processing protein DprA [Clostridia bacterium]
MKLNEKERYLFWLGVANGPGAARSRKLLEAFGNDPKALFEAAAKGDLHEHMKGDAAELLKKRASERYIERCIARLDELNVSAATLASREYPELLKEIYDPPVVLYYKGTLYPQLRLPVAMVGTREPSDYGRRTAVELARALAESGACVISGLAYGIDRACAEGALEAAESAYPTIAVLGSGPDVVYPEANRDVYDKIVERGAVLSEYMPGTEPKAMHFPMRNRIISGLARGVVIVEAGEKSGALITADCALEQGRDAFAVPGRITDPKSAGTNALIRSGMAKLAQSASDVLEEYGFVRRKEEKASVDTKALSFEEELVYRLLVPGERSFDELCELSGFSAALLNSTLTSLEFSGIIKQSPGRLFSL